MEFFSGLMLGFASGWLFCSLALLIYVKIKGRKDKYVKE